MVIGHTLCLWIVLLFGETRGDIRWRRVSYPAAIQKELREYFRRLTQQPVTNPLNFHSAFLPNMHTPSLKLQRDDPTEEVLFPFSALEETLQSNMGGQAHSFASSSASVKRPNADGEVSAKAFALASLKDVDAEEHIGDDIDPIDKSSTFSDLHRTTFVQGDTTYGLLPENTGPYTLKQQQIETVIRKDDDSFSDVYFVAIVAGCCAVGIFGVISAGICFYRLQKSQKAAADVDYPAYGVTGPCKDVTSPNGDRKLAQSAQMYHFQLQKQQMIAVEKAGSTKNTSASDVDSEEENEEGDYTVYECPGLAPTGEMEVKNPLFHDDSTPVSPPMLPDKADGNHQQN